MMHSSTHDVRRFITWAMHGKQRKKVKRKEAYLYYDIISLCCEEYNNEGKASRPRKSS